MYQYSNNRPSIRGGNRRVFRPSQRSRFSKPKFFSSQSKGNNRKVKKLIINPSLYINKVNPVKPIQSQTLHNSFGDFKIVSILQQNIARHGYKKPTPIQDQAIQPILEGRDVIGLASTGTGKTAAFLIPLIHKMFTTRSERTLIIVPTRELAIQINEELKSFAFDMKIYSALVIGGVNINKQIHSIKRNPHVVIATPGRLRDLVARKFIFLEDYSNIVLDEVDLMVDIGFINDVRYFISLMSKVRQSLFFSATIPPKVKEILQRFVQNPITVSVKTQETAETVDQDVIKVLDRNKKIEQLHDLLIQKGFEKVLIFGRTKHGIEKLYKDLTFRGFKAGAIHGNKNQSQRQRALLSFKQNETQILLATDVASRGLDINNVTHVINYDLPETYEDYIHRIGRTGRAGKSGVALTFIE